MSTAKKPSKPAWRSVLDGVDRLITPQANAFVRTNVFADLLAVATRLEVQLRRRVERQTAWAWHLWNLPTAGDVRRMRAQLSALEGRIRDISEQLEDYQRLDADRGLDNDRAAKDAHRAGG
jgi:hypothetical protein